MISIAWLTEENRPEWSPDEQLVIQELRSAGIEPKPLVWDRSDADTLKRYPLAVVRTIWDYFRKFPRFKSWVSEMECAGVSLCNPPSVLKWNMDKKYLFELQEAGLPVVPMRLFQKGEPLRLGAKVQSFPRSVREFVLKPVISAASFETRRFDRAQVPEIEAQYRDLSQERELLLQPYLRTIASVGEASLVYFDGEFSHALLKTPKTEDFRVQELFGGSTRPLIASPAQKEVASSTIAFLKRKFAHNLLYARVDLAILDGLWRVTEIEAIEPSLFFKTDAQAAARMARAVKKRLL